MNERLPGQVEVVASGLVVNSEGKVLLIRSPKWNNTWLIPGGHVDYRESLADAAVREVKEETGLDTKVIRCINMGNLVDDPDFHRATQLVFFHFLCEATNSDTQADLTEITELAWFTPEEALQLNLGTRISHTIENYINNTDTKIDEYIFPPRN